MTLLNESYKNLKYSSNTEGHHLYKAKELRDKYTEMHFTPFFLWINKIYIQHQYEGVLKIEKKNIYFPVNN